MKQIKICDTHNDFLTELSLEEIKGYIKRCKNNNVEKICASYWSTERKENLIVKELMERTNLLKRLDKNYLVHIEDLWWVKDESKLEFLKQLKPFSCSLTWNNENVLAGGSKSEAGLTEWGRRCLNELANANIVIDVAHLNRESFWQVTKVLQNHIYCSHTGFYGVKRHKRNLTDKQIDFIVKSNGFVGLFFYDKCIKVSNNKTSFQVSDIVENIKYFTSHWGFDNLGIGSDFYGIENYPDGISDYCDFSKLWKALKEAGFTEKQIKKIFYQNFIDFYKGLK